MTTVIDKPIDCMLHRGHKYRFAAKLNQNGPSYKFPLEAVIID